MKCFNISEFAITLLQTFLEKRTQCVKMDGKISEKSFPNQLVPVGTISGPFFIRQRFLTKKETKLTFKL